MYLDAICLVTGMKSLVVGFVEKEKGTSHFMFFPYTEFKLISGVKKVET